MKGSVAAYETKSGQRKWQYRHDLPPDPDTGRRRQVHRRGFVRRRDAEQALREALGVLDSGVAIAPSKATLADYLRSWLAGLQVKPTTEDDYRRCVERYVVPHVGGLKLQQLQPEHLDRLYRDLLASGKADGTGLAPKTVRNVHGVLRKALQQAAERGHVPRNVAALVRPPARSRDRTAVKAWDTGQLRRFLDATDDDRRATLWRLLAATGLRRGEALALRWARLDLDIGELRVAESVTEVSGAPVWQTSAKTSSSLRTIALDAGTIGVLRTWRALQAEERLAAGPHYDDADLVFANEQGDPWRPSSVSRWFTQAADRAGLPRIGVHGLRHTHATAALRAGVPVHVVSQRLGHADVSITLDTYAHVLGSDDRTAAERAAAAIFG